MARQGGRGLSNGSVLTLKVFPKSADWFLIAIRIYRRRGRKKKDLNGKQAGGNEWISDFILRTTGQIRCRKQVSSHIQVEKSFLRENKACMPNRSKLWPEDANHSNPGMSLVAAIPAEGSRKRTNGSGDHEEAVCAYENLEYEDASYYQLSQASFPPYPSRISAPIEILASNLYQGPTLRRVSEFAMVLKYKRGNKAIHHNCTSIQSETPSAPKAMADLHNWRELYPALAAYHDRGLIDCPMFLFDAHLSLVGHRYPSNLAIWLSMDFSQGARYTEWRSYPKFYEHNGCPVDLTESFDILESAQLEGTDNCRLGQVPFRSSWWVRVFASMIEEKRMAENSGDPKIIREEEERATQYVRGLSVMQEIWATHRTSNRGPQRMAILLWRFDTARRDEVATTSWRKLVPPLSVYDVQSPHTPSETPPMTLDTALQAASPYAALENPQPSIFSGSTGGDLLSVPLSEESSSSTTPMPEKHSFPSSTSTSFPSSASNSAYPLYSSQGSSFHSQDSTYPPMGILDSQDPGYSLYEHHEVVEASHESHGSHESVNFSQESYASQEVIYHPQDSLYQHALDQFYEYPCDIVEAPVTASASQDFTGGQIHLSYAQTEDSQSPYEAPLIAPQANMVPQHQLIQHPEHFDQHDYLEQDPDDLNCGHDEMDEPAQAQPLPQSYELNGMTIDYSAWEETLRLNPDLERHLSINTVDEVGHIEQQYMSPVGEEGVEQMQGEVLGEVQDEDSSPVRQVESR